jgi:hypothetical protein
MDRRSAEKGPVQLDVGIVLSSVGGNSSHNRDQFQGLVSLSGIDFGLYVGPSYNLFETIGPSIGIGLLIGHNGFLAAKLGLHFKRTFGLAMLIPIVPIYGATGASILAALPVSEGTKACGNYSIYVSASSFCIPRRYQRIMSAWERNSNEMEIIYTRETIKTAKYNATLLYVVCIYQFDYEFRYVYYE